MEGRWTDHDSKMQGEVNLDIQVAYKQLCARATALHGLHRTLRAWLDSPKVRVVSEIVRPLGILEPIVKWQKACFAPDIELLRCYGNFFLVFAKYGQPSKAMEILDRSFLEAQVEKWLEHGKNPPPEPALPVEVKEEPGVFKSSATSGDADKDGKKAKKYIPPPMTQRIHLSSSARVHAATLVSEGLKLYYHGLPNRLASDIKAVQMAFAETERTYNQWLAVWDPLPQGVADIADGADGYAQVLKSFMVVLQCGFDERSRPLATEVRFARKVIDQELKLNTPGGKLAKAVLAYDSMVNIYEASRIHGAQGLEDQAASEIFEATVESLEERFEPAFRSLEDWADPLASPRPKEFDIGSRLMEVLSLKSSLVDLYDVLGRWSTATLQEQLELYSDTVSNVMGLLAASSWTFVAAFARSVRGAFQALGTPAEVEQCAHCL